MADRRAAVAFVLLALALAGCTGQNAPSNATSPSGDGPAAGPDGDDATGPRGTTGTDGDRTEAANANISSEMVWATNRAVVRWDPQTGNRTRIEIADAAGEDHEITAIRWGPDGALYATTTTPDVGPAGTGSSVGTPPGVFRIDFTTGEVETVLTGPPIQNPLALTVLADGRILVADRGELAWPPAGAPSPSGQIVEIGSDGTASILTADPRFDGWLGLDALDGTVFLTTQNDQRMTSPTDAGGTGALWSIDPSTGTHAVVSSSSVFQQPSGLTPAGDGGLYVSEWEGARLLRVDPASGEVTVVSPVNGSQNLWGVDTLPDGRVVVAGQETVWIVDSDTGASRPLVSAADEGSPRHVRVVPSA